jgi:hypothetical protein
MSQTVNLLAGRSSTGAPAFEEVLVEESGSRRYRLLRSPGLTLGLAAGDLFELRSDGTFEVIERGGNVCIQIFCSADLESVEADATVRLRRLGGRLDGKSARELVYTVGASVGFNPIEEALRAVQERHPHAEWYFGNVYDPVDGVTPLNWWKKS